jgi:hypothetical protein
MSDFPTEIILSEDTFIVQQLRCNPCNFYGEGDKLLGEGVCFQVKNKDGDLLTLTLPAHLADEVIVELQRCRGYQQASPN